MSILEKQNKAVTVWLFTVCGLILLMVSIGGFVRLTRSGLSIVEWNPVSGTLPPIGEQAWQEEFAKYQQSPEFQKINTGMTLVEYQKIFYIEYFHRLIARFAGLVVLIPLLYFVWKGIIPWRQSAVYVLIVLLFAFQGFLGWYMVSSGLVDRPAVSHFRLTIHLLTALFLLALTGWLALNHYYHFPKRIPGVFKTAPFILLVLMIAVLVIQISYGGFVAGLKAGWVSNTWPLMHGRLIPPDLLSQLQPWWQNLVAAPLTVHFIHRWFAIAVLLMAGIVYWQTRQKAALLFLGLVCLQILLGISVIWFSVPTWLALVHQAVAMGLFVTAVFITYRLVHEPVGERVVEVKGVGVTAA